VFVYTEQSRQFEILTRNQNIPSTDQYRSVSPTKFFKTLEVASGVGNVTDQDDSEFRENQFGCDAILFLSYNRSLSVLTWQPNCKAWHCSRLPGNEKGCSSHP